MKNIRPKPVVLIIVDGWGLAPAWGGNAISVASTPNFDRFWSKYPRTSLNASGTAVGLPGHEMGNSEVGHLNIGAGRIPRQDISLINKAIDNGSFFQNPQFLAAIDHAKKLNSNLHLLGLLSSGGVHSHIRHVFALLDLLKQQRFSRVFLDIFTDGRDTPPMSAQSFIDKLQNKIRELGFGQISSVSGRYWAMDRDNRWQRTKIVYQALVEGLGWQAPSAFAAVGQAYAKGSLDEYIPPTVITSHGKPIAPIQDNDSIIFFNFRSDRARQIARAFMQPNFDHFPRRQLSNLYFCSMVPYEYELKLPAYPAFFPEKIPNTLPEVLSKAKLTQFHIAETEKYAHVTYFFNGIREIPFPNEDRKLIPSPQVSTYDQKPEMCAEQITKTVIAKLKDYDFILINFANPDMVGHTGNFRATVRAIEVVDTYLGQIVEAVKKTSGLVIITADHGNADQMIDPVSGGIDTEHDTSPVPFILIDPHRSFVNLHPGNLADIAPTILEIMRIPQPAEMTGRSLFSPSPHEKNGPSTPFLDTVPEGIPDKS